ncbi:MAG: nitroreductase [Gemmatimonadetes bacterium]|nr:nitroreductase [Gemmatimonadota bacterium]
MFHASKPSMNLADAIRTRRSVRQFTSRPVTREELEQLIAAATLAPNHRLTQPWRFYVMGPEARRAYGAVLGARKAKKIEDPAAAQAMIDKVAAAGAALPAQVAVAMVLAENLETREEDYAATMMAVQNLALTATALGLGTHIKTGAIMEDPRARAALGVPDGERIVSLIDLGEPAEQREPVARRAAAEVTAWLA